MAVLRHHPSLGNVSRVNSLRPVSSSLIDPALEISEWTFFQSLAQGENPQSVTPTSEISLESVVLCDVVKYPESHLSVSRNAPTFAVARKNGIGSSDFNAEVKAFDSDHIVRGANSS